MHRVEPALLLVSALVASSGDVCGEADEVGGEVGEPTEQGPDHRLFHHSLMAAQLVAMMTVMSSQERMSRVMVRNVYTVRSLPQRRRIPGTLGCLRAGDIANASVHHGVCVNGSMLFSVATCASNRLDG